MFSPIFLSGAGGISTQTLIWIAVAALACVLVAELVGIYVLITKMMRAGEQKRKDSNYRNYGMGVVLLSGAVGLSGQGLLMALTILTMLAALVLAGILVAARVLGYDFSASKQTKRQEEPVQTEKTEKQQTETVSMFLDEETDEYEESEENEQQEQVEVVVADRAVTENAVVTESVETETVEETVVEETVVEETAVEEAVVEETVVEKPVETENPVSVVEQAEPVVVTEETDTKNDGQPYRVVEKIVTETVKEVYKEAPQQAPQQPATSTNDSVVEKLVDLLEYEMRTRRELELAEAAKKAAANSETVATAASSTDLSDEDDDEDEDETDELDENVSENSEELDDEENDAENDRFTGNERIIGFDEQTGCYIVAHYRKSFEAKLIQARPNIKQYYSELKNALLSYKGTKNRISWTADSFHNGRTPIAKINVKTRILELYLALDPDSLEGTVYRGKNVGDKKKYADTPFQYKLRTPRKFKWAMELVQRVCEEKGLTPIDIEKVDYEAQYPFDTTENLVERKLIKEYIRQEKPASSFELDPEHVPTVPTEDETVIPANANFSWEFDNERMVEKEPEVVVEPETVVESEAVVESETVAEPETVVQATTETTPVETVRETVKVTEMRYTERYYSDKPEITQELIVSDPITVESATATNAETVVNEEPVVNAETVVNDETIVNDETVAVEQSAETVVEEEIVTTEKTEEVMVQETTQENLTDSNDLLSHEVVFADDTSYGDGEEYAPVETTEKQVVEGQEQFEMIEQFDDDSEEENETIFSAEYEEIPYEEAPFEDALIEETVFETVENEYVEDGYTEDGYVEDGYVEENYVEDSYTEDGYVEDGYTEETYVEQPAAEYKPLVRESFNPSVAVIDLCSVEAAFRAGEVISLDTLKERNLVLTGVSVLKVYTSGKLGKAFTVEANQFTVDAIHAISEAHGEVIVVQ